MKIAKNDIVCTSKCMLKLHFQMTNIKYLEEKFYKSKSAITAKLMERRREDVRDQMMDLSSKGSAIVQDPATQAEVASRQRRAAEREGRRRRRLQVSWISSTV